MYIERYLAKLEDLKLSFGGLTLEYRAPDAGLEAKLIEMLFAESKTRMARVGDNAPPHVLADPAHWGKPGGLDDLLDKRHKAKHYGRARQWKQESKALVKAQKDRASLRDYRTKPFVCVDCEGFYTGNTFRPDVSKDDVYREQKSFIWGAGGIDGHVEWLCHGDDASTGKRALGAAEILTYLCSLPGKCGDVNFISFMFSYDVTQILAGLPHEIGFQIARRKPYSEFLNPSGLREQNRGVFWKPPGCSDCFVIQYLQRQFFIVGILRDPAHPRKNQLIENCSDGSLEGARIIGGSVVKDGEIIKDVEIVRGRIIKDGRAIGGEITRGEYDYRTGTHITIDDVFGFYQSSLLKAVKDLTVTGHLSEEQYKLLAEEKSKRSFFADAPLGRVKKYTAIELFATSMAMTQLRDSFNKTGLKIEGGWRGAGRVATALLKKHGTVAEHYPDKKLMISAVSATMPPEQKRAHRAYFGGHIEIIKQGYDPRGDVQAYDVKSSYPAAQVILPSMKGGKFKRHFNLNRGLGAPSAGARRRIESANILSMFLVRWKLPEYTGGERLIVKGRDLGVWKEYRFPFFPLPFRTPEGAIMYPSCGMGWYMREEILGALAWIDKFCPKASPHYRSLTFEIKAALEFIPANDAVPFAFIREMFERRVDVSIEAKAAGTYFIEEMNIKLGINSLSGKTAQSIGGKVTRTMEDGRELVLYEPPKTACPFYAAAINANTRYTVLLAALTDPDAIISFNTDAVIATRPLKALKNVLKKGERPRLGAWDHTVEKGLLMAQSGVYSLPSKTMTRGFSAGNLRGAEDKRKWMIENFVPLWEKDWDYPKEYPVLHAPYENYITAGSAAASESRWLLCGWWLSGTRHIDIHSPGPSKRTHDMGIEGQARTNYIMNRERLSHRATTFVLTAPRRNPYKGFSAPYSPEWLDKELGAAVALERETNEILLAHGTSMLEMEQEDNEL